MLPGCQFQVFRRKVASDLVTEQLATIKALGCSSQPQVVVERYQKVSVDVRWEVLARRRTT